MKIHELCPWMNAFADKEMKKLKIMKKANFLEKESKNNDPKEKRQRTLAKKSLKKS